MASKYRYTSRECMQIAVEADASATTVHRCLNLDKGVHSTTERRIQAALKVLGLPDRRPAAQQAEGGAK